MPHMIRKTLAASVLSGVLLMGVSCARKSDAESQKKEQPVPVTLQSVLVQDVQRTIEVVGTLWGREDATVSAKVPGKVGVIFKDVGDVVSPGEPLMQVKTLDYELARKEKEAAVFEALAKVGLKEMPPGNFDATQVPTVVRARLQMQNAESKFNRGKTLHDQQPPLTSDQEFADLQTVLDVSKSNYDVEVLSVGAILAEARSKAAMLDIAGQQVFDTTTRAPSFLASTQPTTQSADPPYSYVVSARMVSVGELVKELTPVFRLVDDHIIKLRASVPERYISDIENGQTVKVNVDAYKQDFWGKISRINPQIDPANRTFLIEVLIPNDKRLLKAGAFAKASVHKTVKDKDVLFAPRDAVVSFAGVNKVFLIDPSQRAQEVNVDLGEQNKDFVEILPDPIKGMPLGPSDQVVVKGTSKLATGVLVSIAAKP